MKITLGVLGVLRGALFATAMFAVAYVAYVGYRVTHGGWQAISSPVAIVTDTWRSFAGRGGKDAKLIERSSAEQSEVAIRDLALIAAHDSLNEVAGQRRDRAMLEIVKVVRRIERQEGVKIPKILEGALSWLPPNWDAQQHAPVLWMDRERPRMLKNVSQADMDAALKLAREWAAKDPGPGPTRYARALPSFIAHPLKRTMASADGETRAQNALHTSMMLDAELEGLGLKTRFYRPR